MREKIIEGFKNGIFPLNHDDEFEEENRYQEEIKNIRNENGLIDYNKVMNLIYFWKKRHKWWVSQKTLFSPRSGRFAQKNEKVKKYSRQK